MIKAQELQQNTPEWHEWRKQGLGASEANIIMGASKFMSPLMLFNQKVYDIRDEKKEISSAFITNKGHRLEEKARPLFEMEMMNDFPDTLAVHDQYPVFRASLDGYCEETNEAWECKFVGQEDFDKVLNGEVLMHYYPQLQHQLMVTGAECVYLNAITDDATKKDTSFPYKTAFVKVLPDDDYIQKELVPELMKFWKLVETKKEPKLSDIDELNFDDNNELHSLLGYYSEAKEKASEWKKKEDKLKADIYKIAKHARNRCNGILITKSKSEDSKGFDYKKFEEENGIPERYEKVTKGRITKRITFPKVKDD